MSKSEPTSARTRGKAGAGSRAARPRTSTPKAPASRATANKASKPVKPVAERAPRPAKVPADVKAAMDAALDKKAIDPVLLDLRQASAFTDFFLIFTGSNLRQVQAIADGIEETLKKRGTRPALIEGSKRAEWVLIDYFDFIVHIFTPATREFYSLERLWGDAERIEVSA